MAPRYLASALALVTTAVAPQQPRQPYSITIALDAPKPYHALVKAWRSKLSPAEQLEWLVTATIWMEGRRDGIAGMQAVASVIQNRARANRPISFGRGIEGVMWKRKAFSCWADSDPNREAVRHIAELPEHSPDRIRWVQAKGVARMMIAGRLKDTTGGAVLYHAKRIKPYWVTKELRLTAAIGDHRFYRRATPAPARS